MSNRQDKEHRREARLAAERAAAQRATRRKEVTWIAGTIGGVAAIALVVVLVLAGRKDSSTVAAPVAGAPAVAVHGVPRQIAANAAQANQVVDGSIRD